MEPAIRARYWQGGRSLYLSVALISISVLMLEIGLTRMFSVMFESHYTFLVISTAILGLGMGGIFVHIRARRISEPYGVPPPVVFQYVPQELKEGISELLFSMHRNLEGKKILQKLMIVRFIAPKEVWYDSIDRMKHNLSLLKEKTHATAKP